MPELRVALELGQNIAVLMLLAFVVSHIYNHFPKPLKPADQLALGIIFGFIAYVGMLIPVKFAPGVIIDGRVVIIAIAGFFGGTTVGLTAGMLVLIYRFFIGGVGTAAGFSEILFAILIGILFHRVCRNRQGLKTHLVFMGLFVTLGSMVSVLALPADIIVPALKENSIPIIIFYPLGTILIGILFAMEGRRMEVQQKLLENEAKYRSMLENLNEGFYNVGIDGTILNHNIAFNQILGFDRDKDLKGLKSPDFWVDPKERKKYLDQLFKEGEIKGYIADVKKQDGTEIITNFNARLIKDSAGKPVRIEGTVLDITEQIKTQRELFEARTMLQVAMNQSTAGIAIANAPDGTLRYVNDAGIKIGGKSRHELVDDVGINEYVANWKIYDVDGKPMDPAQIPLVQAIKKGENSSRELIIHRKKGDERIVFVSAGPVRNKEGEIIAGVAIFLDITEKRQIENSLLESEEFLRTTYKAAENVAFVSTDLGGVNTKILDFSPGAEKIFGYRKTEIINKPISILHTPEILEQFESIQSSLEKGQKFGSQEIISVRKSGERFPALLTIYPRFDANGKVIGALGVLMDISAEKEMEQKLRHSEKMEAIGQLAGGVAHDFNNMLGVIKGYADILVHSLDDDEFIDYAKNINKAADRSATLTNQLLAFARRGQYQQTILDIHQIISETISMLQHTVDKNININQVLKANPSTIKGDSTQILNSLLNLAINASDAMPAGGQLTFATEIVQLDQKYCQKHFGELFPGDYLEILVSDNGIGMDKDIQNHIFEPFFTTKVKGKGTGMGLAAVYGIINNHHGNITVKSTPKKGTTFKIHFPLSSELVDEEKAMTPLKKIEGKTFKIMVVDDEKLFQQLARDLLKKMGYKIKICGCGKEAVEYYKKSHEKIDLVLLDMVMPGMNGKETFLALQKINPQVKVILASGFSVDKDAQAILDKGVMGFIQKPFTANELGDAIAEVLA